LGIFEKITTLIKLNGKKVKGGGSQIDSHRVSGESLINNTFDSKLKAIKWNFYNKTVK